LLTADTWYRFSTKYTKTAISNEPIIDVKLESLDGAGVVTDTVASATLDTATLPAGDRPDTKYFSGAASPAYKNYNSGYADNAFAEIDDGLAAPPPPAGAATWNVPGPADWMDGSNWDTGNVPYLGKAYVTNGGTADLDSAAWSVTEFDIEANSTVNVKPGASLTGTGNWKVGDGDVAGETGTLNQTGGALDTSGDLFVGDGAADYGEVHLSGGTFEIGDDLKLADDGPGLLTLSGTAALTVHGYVAVSNKGNAECVGRLEISGSSSVIHIGDGPGVGNENFAVGDENAGSVQISGSNASINIVDYVQTRSDSTLEVVLDAGGISTINASGNMTLAGTLDVTTSETVPQGIYDVIVAQGGRSGTFETVNLPAGFQISYESGSEKVRLYKDLEPPAAPVETAVLPKLSTWKYLDDGSDQGTAWKEKVFADGGWASGPAVLGYGSIDGAVVATTVSYGPDSGNKYPTTYFRTTFEIADPSLVTDLDLNLLRDDGSVVYINGVEVVRDGVDGGQNYLTYANQTVGGLDEGTYWNHNLSSHISDLGAGTNTIAVETHQVNATSSDLGMDVQLIVETGGEPPPPPPEPGLAHFTATADMRSSHTAFAGLCDVINSMAGGPGMFHVSPGDIDGTVQQTASGTTKRRPERTWSGCGPSMTTATASVRRSTSSPTPTAPSVRSGPTIPGTTRTPIPTTSC